MFGTWSGRPQFKTLKAEYKLLNPPSSEPIDILEAKHQSRRGWTVETTEDDVWANVISAARNQVEVDVCRAICWQRWKLKLDFWPDVFLLYRCPVIAVESVKYRDLSSGSGTLQTVDPAAYVVSYTEPARISTAYTYYWQPSRYQMGAVEVTFTAGYVIPFTANTATDTLTFVDYTPTNGDGFVVSNSGGKLPSPLVANRTYYIVGASGSTCQLALTSGGAAIDLTHAGIGLQFLGAIPGALKQAMLKHMATNFADREGSMVAADCERSYWQSLRASQYAVL